MITFGYQILMDFLHPYGRHCLQAKGYVLWAQGNFDERCKSITVELCHSLVLESTQLMSL